ncbi:DNA cytosine methyltransferase [Candidatus Poribacteria bacterium]|nr:DNA cytosine methyltransferase [Candidatus Poribacteria bacterium]
MKTIATIFSGCGGVELGAKAAGFESIWGVENDPEVAEIFRQNIGSHIIYENAADVDVASLKCPDILWASPPCQAFSSARTVKTPHESHSAGLDIIRYIKVWRPEMFILENVPGFRKSEVFWKILKALGNYFVWFGIVDAADLGVPQHRRRLICIASRKLIRPFPRYAHVGWDAVIDAEHLIEAEFQPSIVRYLPDALPKSALIDTQYSSREEGMPRKVTIRCAGRPAFTICKSHRKRNVRIWQGGISYKLLPRGFARLQSFPDSFKLPLSRQLAIGVLGDAVPPLMAQRIFEAVL